MSCDLPVICNIICDQGWDFSRIHTAEFSHELFFSYCWYCVNIIQFDYQVSNDNLQVKERPLKSVLYGWWLEIRSDFLFD